MHLPILDHGYVEFVEPWGTGKAGVGLGSGGLGEGDYEVGIIEAARQSTQGTFRGWDTDLRLLTHLYNNNHSTPFEFAGMVIEVQAPLHVFREWHRHRTQSYNEMSARYTPLPELYYQPDYGNVMERGLLQTVNKQAGTVNVPQANYPDEVKSWLDADAELQGLFEVHYQRGLHIGIPKEIARNNMPVSHYSRMRAAGNLRNWLAFMTLRCDPKAQWEIRQYAYAVGEIIKNTFPLTHELWAMAAHRQQTPVAWIKGHVSHTDAGKEYDEEVVAGRDQPPGEGWTPLYAR